MSKISELSVAVVELRRCGEALIDISKSLNDLFSSDKPAPIEVEKEEEKQTVPSVTLEQVRTVLAEKSLAGHRAEVQALIHACGADRLSDIDPSQYAELLNKAEAL